MKLPLFSQLRSSAQKLFNRSTREAVEQAMDTLRQHQSSLPVIDLNSLLQPAPVARVPRDAHFIDGHYSNHAGTRQYKLYVPASYHGQPMPLLVMLPGCTQDPDDFAAGTQMNQLAEENQYFVLYPAQSPAANQAKCWNWSMPSTSSAARASRPSSPA